MRIAETWLKAADEGLVDEDRVEIHRTRVRGPVTLVEMQECR